MVDVVSTKAAGLGGTNRWPQLQLCAGKPQSAACGSSMKAATVTRFVLARVHRQSCLRCLPQVPVLALSIIRGVLCVRSWRSLGSDATLW